MEAIILAGGLGTRLRGVIGEAPKCMAPVAGQPFLAYLFRYLEQQGCSRVVLSLGYQHQAVLDFLEKTRWPFEIVWVIEDTPLGTGGGIRLALQAAREASVFVLNGDTFFDVDLQAFQEFHQQQPGETSLALKHLFDFDRYGTVQLQDKRITAFEEKQPRKEGLINGGVYIINRESFLSRSLPEQFSFEKEYLESLVDTGIFSGLVAPGYFIDIGIPADYERAQTDFTQLFPAS
jgi:D-glycero-alpha-D-manno-heptose 1-phosphate guanylyltransferase